MYAVIVLKCKILSNKVCTTFFKWNVALQHYCCQIGIHRNLSKEDYEPKAAFLGYQTINSQWQEKIFWKPLKVKLSGLLQRVWEMKEGQTLKYN